MEDKKSRFHFRKDIKYDIALLSDTNSINPYSVPFMKSTKLWDEVAKSLQNSLLKLPVTGRRCRDRVTTLLKEFRKKEKLSVQASGVVEPDMDEVKSLLTSIATLEDSRPAMIGEKLTSKKERSDAELTRTRAIEEIQENPRFVDEDFQPGSPEDLTVTPQSPLTSVIGVKTTQDVLEGGSRTRKRNGSEMLDYLKLKNKVENEVKMEELKIRAVEAENRKQELELQKRKQEAELENQKKITDLLITLVGKK